MHNPQTHTQQCGEGHRKGGWELGGGGKMGASIMVSPIEIKLKRKK